MICIIEDDDNIRKLVCYALSKEGYEIKGFDKPSEFWEELNKNIPELILLDIMLPEQDGLSILKNLRENKKYEDISVIMLTAKTSEIDKVTGLDMGADDYITKPFGMTELSARVRSVLRRYEKSSSGEKVEYRVGSLYVNTAKHIIKADNKSVNLSYKEYLLLTALLKANGNVVERSELLKEVWGEYYGESRTLDVHIRSLRVKLGNAGTLIKTVKNIGYMLGGAEDE